MILTLFNDNNTRMILFILILYYHLNIYQYIQLNSSDEDSLCVVPVYACSI